MSRLLTPPRMARCMTDSFPQILPELPTPSSVWHYLWSLETSEATPRRCSPLLPSSSEWDWATSSAHMLSSHPVGSPLSLFRHMTDSSSEAPIYKTGIIVCMVSRCAEVSLIPAHCGPSADLGIDRHHLAAPNGVRHPQQNPRQEVCRGRRAIQPQRHHL